MTRLVQIAVAVYMIYTIFPLFTNFVQTMNQIHSVLP